MLYLQLFLWDLEILTWVLIFVQQMLFHAELSLQPICINFMVYSSPCCNVLLLRFGGSFSCVFASVVGSIFFLFSKDFLSLWQRKLMFVLIPP